MFCTECGTKNPDGAKFCSGCGTKLETLEFDYSETVQPVEEAPAETYEAPAEGPAYEEPVYEAPAEEPVYEEPVYEAPAEEPVYEESVYEAPAEEPVYEEPVYEAPAEEPANEAPVYEEQAEVSHEDMYVEPKKKSKLLKLLIPAVAVIALIAVAVIFLPKLGGGKKSSGSDYADTYVYLADGKYNLINELKGSKTESIQFANAKNDESFFSSAFCRFSEDGKYLYYFTKVDDDTDAGTLNRAEIAKLKGKSDKDEKYIVTIDTGVMVNSWGIVDNTKVVYKTTKGALHYYDGKTEETIKKDVVDYRLDKKGNVVFTTGDYSEGYTLYGLNISDISKTDKIASDFYEFKKITNKDNEVDLTKFYFAKQQEDGKYTIYSAGVGAEAEKLFEDVEDTYVQGSDLYIAAENGETVSLYDYIVDEYASDDAGLTNPDSADFQVPYYRYSMITSASPSESSYSELYTSVTKDLYWFGESTWWTHSIEDHVGSNYNLGDDTAAVYNAVKSFNDKYSAAEDENGYILVTDEVKSALKAINSAKKDKDDDEWITLCWYRYQDGYTTDWDAYDAAYDAYYEASDRISMREALQSSDYEIALLNLSCIKPDNSIVEIAQNVVSCDNEAGLTYYKTLDEVEVSLDITEAYSVYDVRNAIVVSDREKGIKCVIGDNTDTVVLTEDFLDELEDASEYGDEMFYSAGNTVYVNVENEYVYKTEIADGKPGELELITDEGYIYNVKDGVLYYLDGKYEQKDQVYGDAYSYKDGKATCLAKDIFARNFTVYDDGVYAYSDYRTSNGSYELSFFNNKGEQTVIDDGVTRWLRVDTKNVLYISSGDLYLYNGKEKINIADDVDQIWANGGVKGTFMYNYYY